VLWLRSFFLLDPLGLVATVNAWTVYWRRLVVTDQCLSTVQFSASAADGFPDFIGDEIYLDESTDASFAPVEAMRTSQGHGGHASRVQRGGSYGKRELFCLVGFW